LQAKENILRKIRQALATPTPVPFANADGADTVYHQQTKEPEIEFAENFTKLLGIFSYCDSVQEMTQQLALLAEKKQWRNLYCREAVIQHLLENNGFRPTWYNNLSSCNAAITTCECLVARTGSIVMSSGQASGRTTSVYAPIHICIAYTSQLVYDVKDGLQLIKEKYAGSIPSLITFATGPSRTADIEKSLVVGVHGPKEAYLFLVQD
jgi:L-lactate dehydrogenase complex protein LldG